MKKPELLSPAGTLRNMRFAFAYGGCLIIAVAFFSSAFACNCGCAFRIPLYGTSIAVTVDYICSFSFIYSVAFFRSSFVVCTASIGNSFTCTAANFTCNSAQSMCSGSAAEVGSVYSTLCLF